MNKGDKKVIRGWVMYDWANSVYQLTIASAIFPIYYNQVTRNGSSDLVSFFGFEVRNTVLYSWAIAAAYLLVALCSHSSHLLPTTPVAVNSSCASSHG